MFISQNDPIWKEPNKMVLAIYKETTILEESLVDEQVHRLTAKKQFLSARLQGRFAYRSNCSRRFIIYLKGLKYPIDSDCADYTKWNP